MQRSSTPERVVLIPVLVFLAACVYLGLHDGLHTFPRDTTTGQRAVSVLQFAYSLLALAAMAGVVGRRRWAAWVLVAWVLTAACCGALATVVWGRGTLAAAVPAFLLVVVVFGLAAWGGIAHARRGAPAPPA